MYVTADEAGVYKGLQQRTPDLEESAKDVRRHLGKGKWTKVTNKEEEADIKIIVLGRRDDPDKGIALGYLLDAGAHKTEDEIDISVSSTVRGGSARDVRSWTDVSAQKSKATYEDLAAQFAGSLDAFLPDQLRSYRQPTLIRSEAFKTDQARGRGRQKGSALISWFHFLESISKCR